MHMRISDLDGIGGILMVQKLTIVDLSDLSSQTVRFSGWIPSSNHKQKWMALRHVELKRKDYTKDESNE